MTQHDHTLVTPAPAWDLTDLYEHIGDAGIQRDLQAAKVRALEFRAAYKVTFDPDHINSRDMLSALRAYEAIHELGMRPYFFAVLYGAAQTDDPRRISFLQKIREQWQSVYHEVLFFECRVMGLSERVLKALVEHDDLSPYKWFLTRLMRQRPYRLGESGERILDTQTSPLRNALITFFDEFLGSLVFSVERGLKRERLHMEEVSALRQSSDPEIRRRSAHACLDELSRHGAVFKHILNAVVMGHLNESRERGYPSVLHKSLLSNGLDEGIMDTVMAEVVRRYPLVRKYWGLKASSFGSETLNQCDLLAPMGSRDEDIPFSKARQWLLECLGEIHPTFFDCAREILKAGRVDAQMRKGKRIGAFCECFAPSLPPYLSVSYGGCIRDMMTLAHEVGHGIHYILASAQSYLNFRPPPILAETASTFLEMVFCDHLMGRQTFQTRHAEILGVCLDDMGICIFRQHALTAFERRLYEKSADHILSESEINDLWWRENYSLFGEAVKMAPEYRWGWTQIPHFIHHPFYCYSYVFGNLLSLYLMRRYHEDRDDTLEVIIHMFRAGGSKDPMDLFSECGIDPKDEAFHEDAFEYLGEIIDSFKTGMLKDKSAVDSFSAVT